MATMDDYTIYCTEEQTKKALELGASLHIIEATNESQLRAINIIANGKHKEEYTLVDNKLINNPTAEQMIGWLEKDYFGSIEPCKYGDNSGEWGYRIYDKSMNCVLYNNSRERQLYSRPEATLAAIDAALNYLSNNKTK